MIKKRILFVTFIMVFLMTSIGFADDSVEIVERPTDRELLESFEVFEPSLSDDSTLNVRDHLYISIKINEEYPIFMDLKKIESTLPELETLKEEAVDEPVNVPVVMITPQEETDAIEVDIPVEEEADVPDETIEAVMILDIAQPIEEPVEKLVEEVSENPSRIQIINRYFELEEQKNSALSVLMIAEEAYLNAIATATELDETFESTDVSINYEAARVAFKDILKEFDEVTKQYNKLFETSVIEPTQLVKTGVLPYFKMNIDTIEDGDYKLVFCYDDENEPFKSIGFTVESQTTITADEIAIDITEILNDLSDVEQTE